MPRRKQPPTAETTDEKADPSTARKKRARLFPSDPSVVRRVVAFDIGIVNMAYAVVTLEGTDGIAIETMCSSNIMEDDLDGGPLSDDRVIAAAVAACKAPAKRRRRGDPPPPPPKKKRGAKGVPLKVLTERLTYFLWARADRLLGKRPHAVAIEQQCKKALRLSSLGSVIHSFVLNYYIARGEEPPPVFMQSGKQKLRVVFRPLPSSSSTASLSSSSTCRSLPIMSFCTRGMQTQRKPVATSRATAKASDVKPKVAGAKPKTRTQQKRSEQGTIWRANKKHAVDNFAPILDNYPGCRRWKPVFQQSKKKDDLADAALHAIFLLKAGGTRLARTKTLDDASLIVLSGPPATGSNATPIAGKKKEEPAAPLDNVDRIIDLTDRYDKDYDDEDDGDSDDSMTEEEEDEDEDDQGDVFLCPEDDDEDEEGEDDPLFHDAAEDGEEKDDDGDSDGDDNVIVKDAPRAKRRRVDPHDTESDDSWADDLGICAPPPPSRRASVVQLAAAAERRRR